VLIEWSISIGNMITIAVTAASVIYFAGIVMGRITNIERTLLRQGGDLKDIQSSIQETIRDNERLNQIERRINDLFSTRDEWRLDVVRRLMDISAALAELYRRDAIHHQDRT
jgi:hypothetical protein